MKILAIETSTMMGSVALASDGSLVAEESLNISITHTERLLPSIDRLLKSIGWKVGDIEGLAISIGPGSFTGLRIGLATVKGLSVANNIPVVAVSSLEALAMNGYGMDLNIVPLFDARKKELYTGIYKFEKDKLKNIFKEAIILPADLITELKKIGGRHLLLGDGSTLYKDMFKKELGGDAVFPPMSQVYPRASNVIQLSLPMFENKEFADVVSLIPNYIRKSDAELK